MGFAHHDQQLRHSDIDEYLDADSNFDWNTGSDLDSYFDKYGHGYRDIDCHRHIDCYGHLYADKYSDEYADGNLYGHSGLLKCSLRSDEQSERQRNELAGFRDRERLVRQRGR